MGLAEESCAPPQSALSEAEVAALHTQVNAWSLREKLLVREFKFDGFEQAMDFVNDVASIAEGEDHHPDFHISYNRVKLELSTHKLGGLSRNDFILAAKIDQLVA